MLRAAPRSCVMDITGGSSRMAPRFRPCLVHSTSRTSCMSSWSRIHRYHSFESIGTLYLRAIANPSFIPPSPLRALILLSVSELMTVELLSTGCPSEAFTSHFGLTRRPIPHTVLHPSTYGRIPYMVRRAVLPFINKKHIKLVLLGLQRNARTVKGMIQPTQQHLCRIYFS
ncbi:hypothetical protein BJV74DRAFT_494716 [Russula compacta]|nr:hypothetical protein BJV74DRAFT_494716 [Russula compacta]